MVGKELITVDFSFNLLTVTSVIKTDSDNRTLCVILLASDSQHICQITKSDISVTNSDLTLLSNV